MDEIKRLKEKIQILTEELARKDQSLHKKNLELDALRHVWCSGGCDKGILRFFHDLDPDTQLTAEQVSMVEINTIRLRNWFEARQCRISQKRGGIKRDRCEGCTCENTCDQLRDKIGD